MEIFGFWRLGARKDKIGCACKLHMWSPARQKPTLLQSLTGGEQPVAQGSAHSENMLMDSLSHKGKVFSSLRVNGKLLLGYRG